MLAGAGLVLMWRQLDRTRSDLADSRVEAAQWKQESSQLMQGLAVAIERQFVRWGLSPAESEVALFLLKGLSHKEIANLRQTSERTVREQARAVYPEIGTAGQTVAVRVFPRRPVVYRAARTNDSSLETTVTRASRVGHALHSFGPRSNLHQRSGPMGLRSYSRFENPRIARLVLCIAKTPRRPWNAARTSSISQ